MQWQVRTRSSEKLVVVSWNLVLLAIDGGYEKRKVRAVAEIKGYRQSRIPGEVPPSLISRPDILLSLFFTFLYGPIPRALTWACRL